jgi:hypothetical protein
MLSLFARNPTTRVRRPRAPVAAQRLSDIDSRRHRR